MQYLDTQGFYDKYEELKRCTKNEFFKFEHRPEYIEYGINDWSRVVGEQMHNIILEAQKSRHKHKSAFEQDKKLGIINKRVRYLKFPLSKYILRQLSTYVIAEEIGEEIYIFEDIEDHVLNKDYLSDFLLFDNLHILKHNYVNGVLDGAFYFNAPEDIAPYLELKKTLVSSAIPLDTFLYNYNLKIPKLL